MFKSLRARLVAAFVTLAVGGIVLVSLLINFTVERKFERYIQENMRERAIRIAGSLGQGYDPSVGLTPDLLNDVTRWSLLEGVEITLEMPPGTVAWHSPPPSASSEWEFVRPIDHPHLQHPPQLTVEEPIMQGGTQVALLRMATGPEGLYSEHDLHFRAGLNHVLELSALGAAVVAVLAAWLMSRGIHRPLLDMTNVANRMRTGDWSQRVKTGGTSELNLLGEALNHLAVALQQHQQLQRRLTRDVAHELRTPLTVLRSHVEAFQDGIWDPTVERIGLFHEEIMRLVRLVEDLNRLAEAESEALHVTLVPIQLRSFLDPLATAYEPLFAQKDIRFQYIPPAQDASILIDRDKASQVIINLLSNAQKYTPVGGEVTLSAAVEAVDVLIRVTDTGDGIHPDDVPRIFEPFFRGDPARRGSTGGSGLGLTIAKTLADACGGRILVDSRVGAGTVFTVSLRRLA